MFDQDNPSLNFADWGESAKTSETTERRSKLSVRLGDSFRFEMNMHVSISNSLFDQPLNVF